MKKPNKYFTITGVLVFLIFNMVLLYRTMKLEEDLKLYIGKLSIAKSELKQADKRLQNKLDIEFMEHPYDLKLDTSFFVSNVDYYFYESTAVPKLVLRFSELNCNSCIDSIISVSKVFNRKYPGNILYFSEYRSERDLYYFKHLNRLKSNVLNLKRELELDPEQSNVPYFFLLGMDKKVLHVHVPDKNNLFFLNVFFIV